MQRFRNEKHLTLTPLVIGLIVGGGLFVLLVSVGIVGLMIGVSRQAKNADNQPQGSSGRGSATPVVEFTTRTAKVGELTIQIVKVRNDLIYCNTLSGSNMTKRQNGLALVELELLNGSETKNAAFKGWSDSKLSDEFGNDYASLDYREGVKLFDPFGQTWGTVKGAGSNTCLAGSKLELDLRFEPFNKQAKTAVLRLAGSAIGAKSDIVFRVTMDKHEQ